LAVAVLAALVLRKPMVQMAQILSLVQLLAQVAAAAVMVSHRNKMD
jgi:hypothetical protein